MRTLFSLFLCGFLTVLLSGCVIWSGETEITEVAVGPEANRIVSKRIPMYLDGFDYTHYGPIGTAIANAYAYNFMTGASAVGTGVTTTYGMQTSTAIQGTVVDILENAGYNIKSTTPALRIVGNASGTGIDFSHFWSDLGINLISFATFGVWGSTRYTGRASLVVYSPEGRRIKAYHKNASWNYKAVSVPFTVFINADAHRPSVEAKAATYASYKCLVDFMSDLWSGAFDSYLPEEYKVLKNSGTMPEKSQHTPE